MLFACYVQGKLVHMGAADIQQAAQDFARKSEALLSSGEMAAAHRVRGEREATERQLEHERRQLGQATDRAKAALQAEDAAQVLCNTANECLTLQANKRAECYAEIASLEERAALVPAGELAKLQALVTQCELMNQQKADFKRQCAHHLEELTHELGLLEDDSNAEKDDDAQNYLEVDRLHVAESNKASQMRRLVGQKGREIASLHRQVDDIPTSAELMQYERRFRELYQQVASKLEETKKFYGLFNTLEEKKGYLSKEVSLLNSIHENYTKAAHGNKDRIADSVEDLLKNVQHSLQKVETRLSQASSSRNAAQSRYDKLIEKQRKYFQLVKDYQVECQRNEILMTS